jgi:6-phosphogluconolactonase (cycloisomerase 2 family)
VGSPFVTAGSAGVLTVAPNGEFLFEGGENTVAAFQIQSGGILTAVPGSPFPNGPNLSGGAPVTVLVTDPQGKFLMTSNVENSSVTVFSIDPNSGTLANVPGSPFPVASKPIGGGSPATIAITH